MVQKGSVNQMRVIMHEVKMYLKCTSCYRAKMFLIFSNVAKHIFLIVIQEKILLLFKALSITRMKRAFYIETTTTAILLKGLLIR